ncbi:hypothetical protein OF829_01855 [Sphingomonas sp. LB-2]|uniref:hypothetical protein n=1 Tax=Sphingomonas caeni TaxID=2984949 RepID=UPI0022308CD1|nr:hypothetical protein [Sphingomonas caeni]MCW3845968.1 hypothetical protein [Sphingomonas caeni]
MSGIIRRLPWPKHRARPLRHSSPIPTVQLFLVQCLDALLRTIARFDGDPLEIPPLNLTVPRLELAEQPDGTMKASTVRPVTGYGFRYSIPPRR